jgi:hypothetical protein
VIVPVLPCISVGESNYIYWNDVINDYDFWAEVKFVTCGNEWRCQTRLWNNECRLTTPYELLYFDDRWI